MTFKLAHLSDLHMGYRATRRANDQGINIREADGYVTLHHIISGALKEKVDAVLISGDVFHTPHPTIKEIIFIQNQLRRLSDAGIKIYILAGNHDVSDLKSEIAASRVLNDPFRGIYSYATPYEQVKIHDDIYVHLVSHHMYAQQSETMSKIKPIKGAINIFSTHGSVIDPILKMKLHTEMSPREVVIPDFLMEDYDWSYILLGHIHERGWVGSQDKVHDSLNKKIYYNGSIIRRGFSDKEVPLGKGWTLWKIQEDGTFIPEMKTVAQRPQEDFKVINAKNKNSKQITEIIIDNLRSTQIDGDKFDPEVAPILRQRIVNITPATYSSLNWSAIDKESKHALHWNIKQIHTELTKEENKRDVDLSEIDLSENNDMLHVYDKWIDNSESMKLVDKNIKEDIKEQARKFVELGQENVLDE